MSLVLKRKTWEIYSCLVWLCFRHFRTIIRNFLLLVVDFFFFFLMQKPFFWVFLFPEEDFILGVSQLALWCSWSQCFGKCKETVLPGAAKRGYEESVFLSSINPFSCVKINLRSLESNGEYKEKRLDKIHSRHTNEPWTHVLLNCRLSVANFLFWTPFLCPFFILRSEFSLF